MENKDMPIYPCIMQQVGENTYRLSKPNDPQEWNYPVSGLSKRELIAATIDFEDHGFTPDYATAISGIPCPTELPGHIEWFKYWNAIEAFIRVSRADALLAELSKPQP